VGSNPAPCPDHHTTSEFETWFPAEIVSDRWSFRPVPSPAGRGPDMNRSTDAPRTSDSRPVWPAHRAARDARRGPFESWFPLGDITMDRSFARNPYIGRAVRESALASRSADNVP
jgi:hypothetical protein